MTKQSLPSPDYLCQRLRYDPDTGLLFWLDYPLMPNGWRARFAGKEALTAGSGGGYRMGRLDYQAVYAHRVAWAIHYGSWPDGEIDHINHDRADNRIINLRDVTRAINTMNKSRSSRNTSGATGVHWDTGREQWVAQIKVNERHAFLGRFSDFDAAVATRKAAEMERGFHENHGR